jgi:hypothetical protein
VAGGVFIVPFLICCISVTDMGAGVDPHSLTEQVGSAGGWY